MAEFVEVMRNLNRLCGETMECAKCIAKDCCPSIDILDEKDLIRMEALVTQWATEHPFTNTDKFEEVFGIYPSKIESIEKRTEESFWDKKYKEP